MRIRNSIVIGLCIISVILSLPNLVPSHTTIGQWFPELRFQLGLDLQGGSLLVLEVDSQNVRKEYIANIIDNARGLLRNESIYYSAISTTNDSVSIIFDGQQYDSNKIVSILKNVDRDLDLKKEGNIYTLTITSGAFAKRMGEVMQQSIEIIRNRIDQTGTKEPMIQRQGESRVMVQLPGIDDPTRIKAILGRTARLTLHLVTSGASEGGVMQLSDRDGYIYTLQRRPAMMGDNLKDAQVAFENGQPVVSFRFDSAGGKRFGVVSKDNIGNQLAFVLDNTVISAPRLNQAILGGQGIITGGFTTEEAQDLALLLRAGALPAPLTVVEERVVGPGLGMDSIKSGAWAMAVGLLLVFAFMLLFYRWLGIVANMALIFNIFMTIAIMSLLGATLTLPGIAGLVLTVGMAVDANVLIYEGMFAAHKESETVKATIKQAFNRVIGTILDSNLTTLFAAIFLYQFGTGPIKGFAVTLTIGLAASMISALFFSRMMVEWLAKMKKINLERKLWLQDTAIAFLKYHKAALIASTLLVCIALGSLFYPGLNMGIDFKGGVMMEIRVDTQTIKDTGQLRTMLDRLTIQGLQIQSTGGEGLYQLRFKAESNNEAQKTMNGIKMVLGEGIEYRSTDYVGPAVSKDLMMSGLYAVGLSLLSIMIYLWIRFEWQFGLAGLIALIHDVIMVLFVLVIARVDFNLSAVAALMTIAGYSINDTVVIFDQIRHNLRKFPNATVKAMIELSMNQTLRRTLNTTLTTFLVTFVLLILGGQALRSFSLALTIGVLLGAYSTVFIATPLLVYIGVGRVAVLGKKDMSHKMQEGYGDFGDTTNKKIQ